MKTRPTLRALTTLAAVTALLCAGGAAGAATISVSGTAPTVDDADIAQLSGTWDAGGDSGHFWYNRPWHGQSFTTGADPYGYGLSSVTLKNLNSSNAGSGSWNVRVGTIDGSNVFNPTTDVNINGTGVNMVGNTFVTWTFDAPLTLDPNTLYGFDVHPNGSGFISANINDNNAYTGGQAFSSGDNYPASPPNALQMRNFDRVFHVDLVGLTPPYDHELTSQASTGWHIDTTWDGGAGVIPTADSLANVHGGFTVTVAAGNPGVAQTVDIDATSTLQIDDTLTVGEDIAAAPGGGISLGAGGQLAVGAGGGSVGTVSTTGNATIETGGDVTATDLNMAASSTFTKAGGGKLSFTSGSNTIDATNIVQVNQGTLSMAPGSNPLGAAGNAGDLVLNGGTFETTGPNDIVYGPLVYDFEGDLNGWTVIPTGAAGNDDTAFASNRNPNSRDNRQQHGSYHISTRNLSTPTATATTTRESSNRRGSVSETKAGASRSPS